MNTRAKLAIVLTFAAFAATEYGVIKRTSDFDAQEELKKLRMTKNWSSSETITDRETQPSVRHAPSLDPTQP